MGKTIRYNDLADYCERNPQYREKFIAESLAIDPARFSKLKTKRYGIRPSVEEELVIADLLNRPASYVRELYRRAA